MHCLACDIILNAEPRERADFCAVCNGIITAIFLEYDIEEDTEIPFGLYEDWEEAENQEALWEDYDESLS